MRLLLWITSGLRKSQAINLVRNTLETVALAHDGNYQFNMQTISTALVNNIWKQNALIFSGLTGTAPSKNATAISSFASGLDLFGKDSSTGKLILQCLSCLIDNTDCNNDNLNKVDNILIDMAKLEIAKINISYDPFTINYKEQKPEDTQTDADQHIDVDIGLRNSRTKCINAIIFIEQGNILSAIYNAEVAIKDCLSAIHSALGEKSPTFPDKEIDQESTNNYETMLNIIKPYITSMGVDSNLWLSISRTIMELSEKKHITSIDRLGFSLKMQRWSEEVSRLYDYHINKKLGTR